MSEQPTYRLIPFPIWALTYTPVIPKAYWDVLSQEESIKNLWLEFDRVRAYINYAYGEMDKLAQELADQLDTAKEALAQAQSTLESAIAIKEEIETLRDECEQIRQQAISELEAIKQSAITETEAIKTAASAELEEQITLWKRDANTIMLALSSQGETIVAEATRQADRAQSIADGMQEFIDNTLARLAEVETLVNTYDARIQALENSRDKLVYDSTAFQLGSGSLIVNNIPNGSNTFLIQYTVNGAQNGVNTPLQTVEVYAPDDQVRFVSFAGSYYATDNVIQMRTVTAGITYDTRNNQLIIVGGRGGYANMYVSQNQITGETGNPYTASNIYIQKVIAKTTQTS